MAGSLESVCLPIARSPVFSRPARPFFSRFFWNSSTLRAAALGLALACGGSSSGTWNGSPPSPETSVHLETACPSFDESRLNLPGSRFFRLMRGSEMELRGGYRLEVTNASPFKKLLRDFSNWADLRMLPAKSEKGAYPISVDWMPVNVPTTEEIEREDRSGRFVLQEAEGLENVEIILCALETMPQTDKNPNRPRETTRAYLMFNEGMDGTRFCDPNVLEFDDRLYLPGRGGSANPDTQIFLEGEDGYVNVRLIKPNTDPDGVRGTLFEVSVVLGGRTLETQEVLLPLSYSSRVRVSYADNGQQKAILFKFIHTADLIDGSNGLYLGIHRCANE